MPDLPRGAWGVIALALVGLVVILARVLYRRLERQSSAYRSQGELTFAAMLFAPMTKLLVVVIPTLFGILVTLLLLIVRTGG